METTRSAVIYARLSVDRDGKKVGIDTQLEDSRKIATERGWNVVTEYVDRNLTAGNKFVERTQYNQMVKDYEDGVFSALICWDLDRLTRQPRQLEDWIDAAEGKGLALVTANGEADLSMDGGRLYARVKVAVAKGETERMSSRQKRSKQARRESGKWHGGPAPFGYSAVDGTPVRNEQEAELIQEAIRRLLHDGETMSSVIRDWNSPTVPGGDTPKHRTRQGNHWRQPNLRAILMNRSLLGETKAGVVGWEPVVDAVEFERVQTLLNDPSRKLTHSPGVKGGKYAMTGGLSRCGHCGGPLVSTQKRRSNGRDQVNIGCLPRVNGPDPKNHPQVLRKRKRDGKEVEVWQDSGRVQIDHDALEKYVLNQVIARLDASPRLKQREAERDPAADQRLTELDARRIALRQERENVARGFVVGIIKTEAEALRETTRIDTELEQIERDTARLLDRPVLDASLRKTGALAAAWETWTAEKRRALLRGFIDRVVVNDWPTGVSPAVPRERGETPDEHRARQEARMQVMIAKRVVIEWRKPA